MSYKSKFTGEQVDEYLTRVEEAGNLLEIKEGLSEKADKSGYYPSMRVGLSDNLPDRRDVTEGFIGFRESAGVGNSIEDGTAEVVELLGNSVVWNQWAKPFEEAYEKPYHDGITYNGNKVTIDNWIAYNPFRFDIKCSTAKDHLYLVLLNYANTNPDQLIYIEFGGENSFPRKIGNIAHFHRNIIYNNVYKDTFILYVSDTMEGTITLSDLQVIDLTLMFGAGNEPTTIEEFYANIPNGVDPYAYNEGEVVGVNMTGIKSVNDNAWDEEWELGFIDSTNGNEIDSPYTIRSKNYNKILGGEQYYVMQDSGGDMQHDANCVLVLYDENKNYLDFWGIPEVWRVLSIDSRARYFKIAFKESYGTTYKNDVIISLYHSGYKTDYVPHEEDVMPFKMPKELPYGMHGINGISDSVKKDEVVRRIGVADLGVRASEITPSLCYNGEYRWRLWIEPNIKPIEANDIAANMMSVFDLGTADSTYLSKNGIAIDTENYLWIYDSRYVNQSDKDAMVEFLQGKKLYYELAEPVVTKLDSQLNLSYRVWDFGTEELLCDQPSTDVRVRTIYGFNATDTIRGNKTKVNEHEVKIDKIESTMVQKDGYAPRLTSGFSDDLVGRGESVPAEFSFRASGGKSIKDGAARIKRLKGNSVVWNQGFTQGLWSVQDGTLTIEDNTYIVTPSGEYPGIFPGDMYNVRPFPTEKVLVELDFYSEGNDTYIGINLCGNNISDYNLQPNTWQHIAIIATCDREDPFAGSVIFGSPSASVLKFKNMRFYNLTKMFGAGNEPTTIEEFNARKPIVADEYAYNEGEVIHMTAEGIKSIGDNAWDEEWEEGSISEVNGTEYDSIYQFRTKNYIRVLPNTQYYFKKPIGVVTYLMFYDDNKNFVKWLDPFATVGDGGVFTTPNAPYMRFVCYESTYKNDITISLYHSGWKAEDAKYQPYWEDRLMFDKRIKDEFPNGMSKWDAVYNKNGKGYIVHGLGKVDDMANMEWETGFGGFHSSQIKDSIKQVNGYIISNVLCSRLATGIVGADNMGLYVIYSGEDYPYNGHVRIIGYDTLDALKASLAGVPLYYQLAEPTIIEYDEPFNLDYEVADFGTEEIIASKPSAPISADIIYQFNAVDMIREHELEITELQRIIATMQAQMASLTYNNGGQ